MSFVIIARHHWGPRGVSEGEWQHKAGERIQLFIKWAATRRLDLERDRIACILEHQADIIRGLGGAAH